MQAVLGLSTFGVRQPPAGTGLWPGPPVVFKLQVILEMAKRNPSRAKKNFRRLGMKVMAFNRFKRALTHVRGQRASYDAHQARYRNSAIRPVWTRKFLFKGRSKYFK